MTATRAIMSDMQGRQPLMDGPGVVRTELTPEEELAFKEVCAEYGGVENTAAAFSAFVAREMSIFDEK